MTEMNQGDAVRIALAEEMRRDPLVWALGEDLSTAHGDTSGSQYYQLIDEFGPKRIVNTPISENTIMGAAVGAAVAGTRPVADLRMADFAMCAVDELVNQAAKIRYMFGGQARVPLVVRQMIGMRKGSAAQHSQRWCSRKQLSARYSAPASPYSRRASSCGSCGPAAPPCARRRWRRRCTSCRSSAAVRR